MRETIGLHDLIEKLKTIYTKHGDIHVYHEYMISDDDDEFICESSIDHIRVDRDIETGQSKVIIEGGLICSIY